MWPPNDRTVCAFIAILWMAHCQYHEYPYGEPDPRAHPEWVRTPAQERIRELSARIRSGR